MQRLISILLLLSLLPLINCNHSDQPDITSYSESGNQGSLARFPKKDLVAYYPFCGNAADESGNEHHGTVYGATLTNDRFGKRERAYEFDGVSNYILIPSSTAFSLDSNFSVSLWIKHESYTSYDVQWILWNGNTDEYLLSDSQVWMVVANQNSKIAFEKYGFGNAWLEGPDVQEEAWTHIVAIVGPDGDTGQLYVNNSYYGSTSTGGPFELDPITEVVIGKRGAGHDLDYFDGAIDDIRIFDRMLDEQEIERLYHEGGWQ